MIFRISINIFFSIFLSFGFKNYFRINNNILPYNRNFFGNEYLGDSLLTSIGKKQKSSRPSYSTFCHGQVSFSRASYNFAKLLEAAADRPLTAYFHQNENSTDLFHQQKSISLKKKLRKLSFDIYSNK